MSEEEEVSRVSMMWPVTLKEAVREKVGARGLTNFAIEAVRTKLEGHGPAEADSKELVEVKFLVQQLADAIATTGDYSDPLSTLQEIGLPSWVETMGWSDELAALVPQEIPEGYRPLGVTHDDVPDVAEPVRPASSAELADHVFEPSFTGRVCEKMVMRGGGGDQCGLPPEAHAPVVPPIEEAEADELHRPMALTGTPKGGKSPVATLSDEEAAAFGKLELEPEGPAVGDPGTVRPAEKDDLFARIQAAAADKGVDMSGIDLKPASEVKKLSTAERDEKMALIRGADEGHNHAWTPLEDPHKIYASSAYVCACGATMDAERVYEFGELPGAHGDVDPEIAAAYDVPADKIHEIDPSALELVTPSEVTTEPASDLEVPADAPSSDVCPKCGSELVAGECWIC